MESVELEQVAPHVKVIRLNRPNRLNALSFELVAELHTALDAIAADADCKVAILTGAGRGFCSGLDLRDWGTPPAPGSHPHAPVGVDGQAFIANLTVHIRNTPQVVIAAVNGAGLWRRSGALVCRRYPHRRRHRPGSVRRSSAPG